MTSNFTPSPTCCSVSPNGIIGYSRGPRRIDLYRAKVLANAHIAAHEANQLSLASYRRKRAAELDALRAAKRTTPRQRPAPPAALVAERRHRELAFLQYTREFLQDAFR